MSDNPNPKNWREAVPYVVWGILAFSFGMEGCVTLVHFEWLSSFVSFAGMLAVISLYFAKERIVEKFSTLHGAWFFIVPLFCLAALTAAPILSERSHPRPTGATADEIAAAVVKALPKPTWDAGSSAGIGQMPIGGAPTESVLEQPVLIWDGKDGSITFRARVDRSGEKLPVYLDWGPAGVPEQTIFNNGFYSGPRVEIGFVERFVVGQSLSVTIGTVSTIEGGQQVLQWGEPHYNNAKVGISQGAYVARVVIIGKDGKEERYPFLIIPTSHTAPWAAPALVGTGVLQGAIQ
jgi:hypothetical protein